MKKGEMMKTLYRLLIFLLMINIIGFSELHSQIIINIKQPPPNKLMVEDLWQIQINNLSGKSYTVFLTGKLSMVGKAIDEGLWWFEAITNRFPLEPGITRLNLQMISPVKIDYSDKKYYDIILKTGSVPEGEYDYCVKVIESSTNEEIAKACLPQLQIVRNVWPPKLISPADGQIVEDEYPMFAIILQNDHPTDVFARMVEIIGYQSPIDALKSNPAWFTYTTKQLSFKYPTWARKFEDGKSYAWQVTVYSKSGEILSVSEPSSFTVQYDRNMQNKYRGFSNLITIKLVKPANGKIVEDEYPEFGSVILQNDIPVGDLPRKPDEDEQKLQRIVEIKDNQTPLEAINSNTPVCIITSQDYNFIYPKDARKLENGKKYAWQIKIFNKDGSLKGISDVGYFYYRTKNDSTESDGTSALPLKNKTVDFWSYGVLHYNYPSFKINGIPLGVSDYSNNNNENDYPIKFLGNTKFFTQSSNRQGTNSEMPKNFWRWDINTVLSIYDIPIGFNAFLSSEQKDLLQNINIFQLQLSPQQYINKGIEKTGSTFLGDFLSLFSNIGVGTVYPRYSGLSINGIAVSGVDIEFTPGIFYLAFTYGRTQKAIEGNNILPTYQRKIISSRIGLGKRQASHFYLTASKSWDDAASIKKDTFLVKPQENYLLGAEAKVTLFNQIFSIEGEFVASVLTRDTKAAELETDLIPDWVTKLIKPKISTSADYAYSLNTNINLPSNTRLSGTYKYIGPGFTSHGIPFLKNDLIVYELKAEQRLFERSVTAKFYYRNNYDNLIPWKKYRTTINSYGINLELRLKDFPYIQINYSPYFLENDSRIVDYKFDNKTKLISVMTGYNYSMGSINYSSNIFFSYQDNSALTDFYKYTVRNYTLNQTIGFKFPLFLSATASIMQSDYYQSKSKIYSLDLTGSYTAFENWVNSIGINYTTTKDFDKRTGFYFYSLLPIADLFNVELRAEKNFYNDLLISAMDFNEFIFQLIIAKNW